MRQLLPYRYQGTGAHCHALRRPHAPHPFHCSVMDKYSVQQQVLRQLAAGVLLAEQAALHAPAATTDEANCTANKETRRPWRPFRWPLAAGQARRAGHQQPNAAGQPCWAHVKAMNAPLRSDTTGNRGTCCRCVQPAAQHLRAYAPFLHAAWRCQLQSGHPMGRGYCVPFAPTCFELATTPQ